MGRFARAVALVVVLVGLFTLTWVFWWVLLPLVVLLVLGAVGALAWQAWRDARREPLGLEAGTVRLVPSHPAWPELFAAEAERLRTVVAAAGLPALELEHVGSTAVPGLAAKPVLDIAAARPAGVPAAAYVPALERAGYLHRGDGGLPGREFFRRGEPRSYHLHLVEAGGTHWRRYLAFRDALRADRSLLEEYGALKSALAARYARDREAYMTGKGPFVERVLGDRAGGGAPAVGRG